MRIRPSSRTAIPPHEWEQVLRAMGVRRAKAEEFAPHFSREFDPALFSQGMVDIVDLTPQVLHECALLERMEENLSYSAERLTEVWPSRFPTLAAAKPYEHNPQALAEKVYGGRMGNTIPGRAWLCRGQGPIMFTGWDTYLLLEQLTDGTPDYQDYTVQPWVVQQPGLGLAATRAWWEHRIPDGCLSDQVKIRRRVNGGRIGLGHCIALADACRRAFA